jgi:DNA-binding NarL/FixJ family response regulator
MRRIAGPPIPVGIHGFVHAEPDGNLAYAGLVYPLRKDVPTASPVTLDGSRYDLDQRDHSLLQLLVEGFSDEEIAVLIGGISIETVRRRVQAVRLKLNVSSRTEACIRAIKAHLIL